MGSEKCHSPDLVSQGYPPGCWIGKTSGSGKQIPLSWSRKQVKLFQSGRCYSSGPVGRLSPPGLVDTCYFLLNRQMLFSWSSWQMLCFWSRKIEEKQGLKTVLYIITQPLLRKYWFSVHYYRRRGEWPSRSVSRKGCKRHNYLTTVATIGSGKH